MLLQLYAVDGRSMLERLNGIFAFAVWDRRDGVLFAARDQMGVKPFYYVHAGDRLLFASEIKAILAGGWCPATNLDRVGEYLLFGSVAGEDTLFQGVRRLAPGGWMEFRPGHGLQLGRYFDPSEFVGRDRLDDADSAASVRRSLAVAVARQMVSDVPVGSMCSGGLDSSGLTALAAQHNRGINTYCIKIAGPRYDETAFSHEVALHCATTHHEIESSATDVAGLLPTAVWLHDEPLRHPNSIPIFQVSRLAKESITVLLSGEGADELFGGYYVHKRTATVRRLQQWAPRPVLSLALEWCRRQHRPGGQKALTAALAPSAESLLVGMRTCAEPDSLALLTPDVRADLSRRLSMASVAWKAARGDPTQAAIVFDQMIYLPTLLERQDKMCMGTSVEGRVPYLDVDLVRLVNGLASAHKVRGETTKVVLRLAVEDLLPVRIKHRKKYGFGIPLTEWLREGAPLGNLLSLLERGHLVRNGIVRPDRIGSFLASVRLGDATQTELAWNLLNLEVWWGLFIARDSQPDLDELPAWRARRREAAC